jgi:S1-C subfamily serine protease
VADLDRTLQALRSLKAHDCPPLRTLGDFLDGNTLPAQTRAVDAHLECCPACTNLLIDLRELARLERDGDPPPAELLEQLNGLVRSNEFAPEARLLVRQGLYRRWSATLRGLRPQSFVGLGFAFAGSAVALVALYLTGVISIDQGQRRAGSSLTGTEKRVVESVSLAIADPDRVQKYVDAHQAAQPALEGLPNTLGQGPAQETTNVEVYKKAAPATVLVLADERIGSGVVISGAGDVVTNWHVVGDAKQVAVVFKPEHGAEIRKELAFRAALIKVDEVADLALLRIVQPPKNVPYLPLGDAAKVEVGQNAHSIGHPKGELWTYTVGTVSQIRPHYEWKSGDGLPHRSRVIQTQTAINPGNSGGPLLNDRAEIIGINSFRREGEGLNYAVAADVVSTLLQSVEGRAAASPPRAVFAPPQRSERYTPNIVGAYTSSSTGPPDMWFVYRGTRTGEAAYAALGSIRKTQIDTIIKPEDATWGTRVYYFDTDCDGTIDLIGRDRPGSQGIENYQRPQEPLQLSTLGNELVNALMQHKIPPQIQFCGTRPSPHAE